MLAALIFVAHTDGERIMKIMLFIKEFVLKICVILDRLVKHRNYLMFFLLGFPLLLLWGSFLSISLTIVFKGDECYSFLHELVQIKQYEEITGIKGNLLCCFVFEIYFLFFFYSMLCVENVTRKADIIALHIYSLVFLLPLVILGKGMADAYAWSIASPSFLEAYYKVDGLPSGMPIYSSSIIIMLTSLLPLILLVVYDFLTLIFVAFLGVYKKQEIHELRPELERKCH